MTFRRYSFMESFNLILLYQKIIVSALIASLLTKIQQSSSLSKRRTKISFYSSQLIFSYINFIINVNRIMAFYLNSLSKSSFKQFTIYGLSQTKFYFITFTEPSTWHLSNSSKQTRQHFLIVLLGFPAYQISPIEIIS